jgi:hypothetical protein
MAQNANKKSPRTGAAAAANPAGPELAVGDGTKPSDTADDQLALPNRISTAVELAGAQAFAGTQGGDPAESPLAATTSVSPTGDQSGTNQGSQNENGTNQAGAPGASDDQAGQVKEQALSGDLGGSASPATLLDLAAAGAGNSQAEQYTYGVEISATRDGFRRAGRAWYREPTFIREGELSEEQVALLLAEPNIRCVGARRLVTTEGDPQ